jgi:hypothetical protein
MFSVRSAIGYSVANRKLNCIYMLDQVKISYRSTVEGIKSLFAKNKNKLRGLSPRANYTDRATAAFRRS